MGQRNQSEGSRIQISMGKLRDYYKCISVFFIHWHFFVIIYHQSNEETSQKAGKDEPFKKKY